MMVEDLRNKPTKATRAEIVSFLSSRDGYFCYICGKNFEKRKDVTIDHFWPLAHGGTWDLTNLRLACQPCNNLKGDTIPNSDGTVNFVNRKQRTVRLPRPMQCEYCGTGRLLLLGEICEVCGSGPQPIAFPRAYKAKSKNCDHNVYHCFACIIGLVERKNNGT